MSSTEDSTTPTFSLWGWERFFGEVVQLLEICKRQSGIANEQLAEHIVERLEICIGSISRLRETIVEAMENHQQGSDEQRQCFTRYNRDVGALVESLQSVLREWQQYATLLERSPTSAYSAPPQHSGGRGRPSFHVPREQLEYLRSMSFSWSEIATLLGVSRMTVYRRRLEYGLLGEPANDLTLQELCDLLQHMRADSPYVGETMVWGRLRSLGYKVTRNRVRHAIRVTDPLSTALRSLPGVTSRRPYSVPGPNSLWHIDGHHKLIRWKLVTHAGIDGYSRLIVYIHCSPNNKASTVYSLFAGAVDRFGLPSRVRSDQGGENVVVAQCMLERRGADRGSMLTGSSTHNQRIERLWRDLHRCVIMLYYRLFYHLENLDLLNPTNDHHIYALHYVYLHRINQSIHAFRDAWNCHKIRTEHNKTPHQLFTRGMLQLQSSGLAAVDFFSNIDNQYGVVEEGLVSESEGVSIPEVSFNLTNDHYSRLQHEVDRFSSSENYAIDIYEQTLTFINNIVSQNPGTYL